jgi:GNAT superfamily N-acetyltransferase
MRTTSFLPDEITSRRLEDSLLPPFDCGREAQNEFLHAWAWRDQEEWLSTTHVYFVRGIFAAYAAVSASSLVLGTREKPQAVRHRAVGALKLLQLGVDGLFQGRGVGSVVIADMIALARVLSRRAGCRYLSLDAQPDLTR